MLAALARVTKQQADVLLENHPEDCDCRWCTEEPEAVADILEDVRAMRWALNTAGGFIESSTHGSVLLRDDGGMNMREGLRSIAREFDRLRAGCLPVRCRPAGTAKADEEGDEDDAPAAVVKPR